MSSMLCDIVAAAAHVQHVAGMAVAVQVQGFAIFVLGGAVNSQVVPKLLFYRKQLSKTTCQKVYYSR